MWACGSDFQYQNADHWFHNLDKIIHYVNINASLGGPVKAFYSTPSHYTDSVKQVTKAKGLTWEVRTDDVFPLANTAHAYWSGYFTSRPALKRQVRFATNFLGAARQMEVITGITSADVDQPTTRPSPPVGDSWTDSLEGSIGVATHHDGMSGTERQSVADDYEQRISESHFEVETGVAKALQKLTGSADALGHCNCNAAGNCLNMSVCAYTTGVDSFSVIAWNPLGQAATPWINVPVNGATWAIADHQGKPVAGQTTPIDDRTKQLPLLYINSFKMDNATLQKEMAAVSNKASHVVSFRASVPALGYTVYTVKASSVSNSRPTTVETVVAQSTPNSVTNGIITLDIADGAISSITNVKSGVTTPLSLTWGYYVSSPGGTTFNKDGTKMNSNQASGAYLFRPINQTTINIGPATLEVTQGPLITEIKQVFDDYATHVVRLRNGSSHVEVEWTAGPIPFLEDPLPPGPAPGGCTGWVQTTKCNAHGTVDPKHPKVTNCSAPIPQKSSGYCACADGVKVFSNGCNGSPTATCEAACDMPVPKPQPMEGRELVLKFTSGLKSSGTFYTDSNGREMVKRVRDARGPSYPPLVVNEPVAGNYYPVNSMISLDDGTDEMVIVTDVSMGGSSMEDGEVIPALVLHCPILSMRLHEGSGSPLHAHDSCAHASTHTCFHMGSILFLCALTCEPLRPPTPRAILPLSSLKIELMVHRRIQTDDHRGVQEPLNETMCGCNDVGAAPGSMGAHGHEGDGGCACAGLTVRGVAYIVVDTVTNAHAARRALIETLNFPPTLAFSAGKSTIKTPTFTALSGGVPANVKLVTLTNNYQSWLGEKGVLLRFAHMYAVDEHPTLAQPVVVNLAQIFGKSPLKIVSAEETTLTGNQPRAAADAKIFDWPTEDPSSRMYKSENAFERRFPFDADALTFTIRPMEVRTFIAKFA